MPQEPEKNTISSPPPLPIVLVAAVALVDADGRVLLAQRPPGKAMAGLIGLARDGVLRPGERVLFVHTGGLPALHAYERVLLGDAV